MRVRKWESSKAKNSARLCAQEDVVPEPCFRESQEFVGAVRGRAKYFRGRFCFGLA